MKLTKVMKDRIIKSIMTDTFTVREQMVEIEKTKLANRIYADYYDIYKNDMARLPESFFLQKSSINVKFGNNDSVGLSMGSTRLVGKQHEYGRFEFEENNPRTIDYRAIQAKMRTLSVDRDNLRSTLQSIIHPITTDKRLIEVWPDAEQHIPRTAAATVNLPVIQVDGLNALISSMKEVI